MDCAPSDDEISSASNRKEIRSASRVDSYKTFGSHLNRNSTHLDESSSLRAIRLMAIKGFTEKWATRDAILRNNMWEIHSLCFPSGEKKAASEIVQQGDVNVNGTPTAFNPDLSHTHRRPVLLKLLQFLCQREKFSIFFASIKTRNKSNEIKLRPDEAEFDRFWLYVLARDIQRRSPTR